MITGAGCAGPSAMRLRVGPDIQDGLRARSARCLLAGILVSFVPAGTLSILLAVLGPRAEVGEGWWVAGWEGWWCEEGDTVGASGIEGAGVCGRV